jgi:hypothetical protein
MRNGFCYIGWELPLVIVRPWSASPALNPISKCEYIQGSAVLRTIRYWGSCVCHLASAVAASVAACGFRKTNAAFFGVALGNGSASSGSGSRRDVPPDPSAKAGSSGRPISGLCQDTHTHTHTHTHTQQQQQRTGDERPCVQPCTAIYPLLECKEAARQGPCWVVAS